MSSDYYAGIAGEIAGPCPVEAVFGPDDRVPCLLERGHEPPCKYTPDGCGSCGCLPADPLCGGCMDAACPCSDSRDTPDRTPLGEQSW